MKTPVFSPFPVERHGKPGGKVLIVVRWTIIALSGALVFVLLYATTLTQIPDDTARPPEGVIESLRWRTSDPITVRRYLGFSAVGVALSLLIWVALQKTTVNRRRCRWDYAREAKNRYRTPGDVVEPTPPEEPSTILRRDSNRFRRPDDEPQPPQVAPEASLPEAPTATPAELLSLEVDQEIDLFGSGELSGQSGRGVLVERSGDRLVIRLYDHSTGIPWSQDDSVHGYYWLPDEGGYLFQVRVLERSESDPSELVVAPPAVVTKQQRRVFVRVACRVSFRFVHVPGNADDESPPDFVAAWDSAEQEGTVYDGLAEDLSAGGFRMVTDAPLREGDYLSIQDFEPASGLEIVGRVSAQLGSHGEEFSRFGLQFVGVQAQVVDQITREVFRMQRENLRLRDDSRIFAAAPSSNPEASEPTAS